MIASLLRRLGRRRLLTLLTLLLSLAIWALVLTRLRVGMAITHFLPNGSDSEVAEILRSLTEGDLVKTTILDVSLPPDAERGAEPLIELTQKMQSALKSTASVERVRSGLEPGDEQKVMGALSSAPPSAFLPPEAFAADALRPRLEALRQELGGPLGPLSRALAPRDPFGATLHVLETLRRLEGQSLTSSDGVLLSEDQAHAFLFVHSRGSAFDADVQRVFLADVQRAFEAAGGRAAGAALEMSSVARYTVASEEQIRGDIERIGTLSTVGILLLFGVFFRSLRMLALAMVPLLFGTLFATVLCYFAFGEIHGVTLAFGSSLLGVGIDYAEHYYTHYALSPQHGPDGVMREVRPGLWLGAVTTILGLLGIAWADFPGAVELSVFACLAVAGSAIGTVFFLPPWMPTDYRRPPLPERLESWALRLLPALRQSALLRYGPLVCCAVLAAGLWKARFVDDVSVLISTDPELSAEDARVRGRITRAEPGRFVVVRAHDEQAALQKLSATHAALLQAHREGLLEHFVPLGELLRPEAAQRASFQAAQQNAEALREAMRASGFEPAPFAPYFESLEREPTIFRQQALLDSPLGELLRPLCQRLGDDYAFIVPLGGVRASHELAARLPDAVLIDERELIESTYSHVRSRVMQLVGVGLVLVLVILRLRYGSLRVAVAAFLPAVASGVLVFGTLGWLGVPLNVLHAVGLVLVLSMGVDFGIFVAEGRKNDEDTARALVGIFTATLTTLLSFGLLALSRSPALQALGSTMTLGLVWSLLLCPIVFVLSEPRRKEAAS